MMGIPSISRRSALAVSFATVAIGSVLSPAMAAITPTSPNAAQIGWRQAKQAYLAAVRAAKEYERDYHIPAYNAFDAFCARSPSAAGDPAFAAARAQYRAVEEIYDDLSDRQSSAHDALIAYPAPDVGAVAFKLQLLADGEAWDTVRWDEQFGYLMADLARLGRDACD